MRRSAYLAFLCMGLSLCAIFLVWRKADDGAESFFITQEALSGDPQAASGVTLHIASHWDGRLLWDTDYTIGGDGAESDFRFSSRAVEWETVRQKRMNLYLFYGDHFDFCETEGSYAPIEIEYLPYPEAVRAVAERAPAGTEYKETVRLGDYYGEYPMDLSVSGSSVVYEDDQEANVGFLTRLFQIGTEDDELELTVEKDVDGSLLSVSGHRTGGDAFLIAEASAFGKEGGYYAFACEDMDTGERAKRGAPGLFYQPFVQEDGLISLHWTQMRRLCDLPEDAVPIGMLLEEEKELLYLAVRGTKDYKLLVYRLEGETPVLEQSVAFHQDRTFLEEGRETMVSLYWDGQFYLSELADISLREGGLLLTWRDNRFSFLTEEDGQYRLWCSGRFPEDPELDWDGYYARINPFPWTGECLFDGERLVLAAFKAWESLDVLVAVYGEEGELYSGLYRHSGEPYSLGYRQNKIMPQGNSFEQYQQMRLWNQLYGWEMDTSGKPLKLTAQ